MLALSLRAVLRKESWMFCAGLLLSIADLLNFVDCDVPTAGPQAQWAGSKQQHVPGSLPAATGTRGDNPAGPRLNGSAIPARRCLYDTAIRVAFQPKVTAELCPS